MIGCHAAQELTRSNHKVSLFDLNPNESYVESVCGKRRVKAIRGDLLDLPGLLRALKDVKPAVVVHTAGLIGGQVSNPPYRGIHNNILGSANIFEACQLSGVKRIVHVSTFGVYDWENIRRGPVKENFPRWGNSFYHATKVANELLVGAYQNFYGLETVVIRPSSVYGPGHYRGGSGGGRNMSMLMRDCLGSGPIILYGKRIGHNDFVYAKDVGRGIALACTKKGAAGKAFNIGTGKIYGPRDFLRILRKLLPHRNIRIAMAVAGGREGSERIPLDLSQSKKILGFVPQYPLEKGLKNYLLQSREIGFWN